MPDHDRRRLRPLFVRPGARFTCFVDGICCTDIHRLGPIEPRDVRRLRLAGAGEAVRSIRGGEPELRRTAEGRCTLLAGTRCSLHGEGEADHKPGLCRRYPFALVATPLGGRVTTAHRCPCRTLGERPLLTPESAEPSLLGPGGKLASDREVPVRILLRPRTSVSFSGYAELEAPLLDRLAKGEPPASVLAIDPGLPRLRGGSWRDLAGNFTAFGAYPLRGCQSLAWFGDGILLALGDQPPPRDRPWIGDFDRAEQRVLQPEPPEAILGDWLADLVWGLSWVDHGPFDRARTVVGALAEIASAVASRLAALGVRPDRAAAEALLVAESGAYHRFWADAHARIEPAARWMTTRSEP